MRSMNGESDGRSSKTRNILCAPSSSHCRMRRLEIDIAVAALRISPRLRVFASLWGPVTVGRLELLLQVSVRSEVLPDLVDHLGIDDAGVRFSWLLLRVEHELDGSALWAERTRIEGVETLVNGVTVADALLQLERM